MVARKCVSICLIIGLIMTGVVDDVVLLFFESLNDLSFHIAFRLPDEWVLEEELVQEKKVSLRSLLRSTDQTELLIQPTSSGTKKQRRK